MIKLDETYYIDSDDANFILCKQTVLGEKSKKAGECTYKNIGYFNTLNGALKSYANMLIRDKVSQTDMTLSAVLRVLKEINETIDNALNRYHR